MADKGLAFRLWGWGAALRWDGFQMYSVWRDKRGRVKRQRLWAKGPFVLKLLRRGV